MEALIAGCLFSFLVGAVIIGAIWNAENKKFNASVPKAKPEPDTPEEEPEPRVIGFARHFTIVMMVWCDCPLNKSNVDLLTFISWNRHGALFHEEEWDDFRFSYSNTPRTRDSAVAKTWEQIEDDCMDDDFVAEARARQEVRS